MSKNIENTNGRNTGATNLFNTNIDIDPIGAVFSVTSQMVEDAIMEYLKVQKKIDGIEAVRLHVVREGSDKPEIALYVFLNPRSQDITSNMNHIPDRIRNKMEEGSYRLTQKLKDAMFALTKDFKVSVHPRKVLYIKCNIFKALGLMVAANPKFHNIIIASVYRVKKGTAIMTVLKQNKFIDRNDSTGADLYTDIIRNAED